MIKINCNALGISPALFTATMLTIPCNSTAQHTLSGGFWANYQYLPDDEANKNSWGEIGSEALILYLDGAADEADGRWLYSAEVRAGRGSFTDPDNNSSGDQWGVHKAWVGWQLSPQHQIKVGKSQVPFGWKSINFWPGDMLLGGYGDQMDVGAKLEGDFTGWRYDAALYLADDWGTTSTDTMDDNGHWGSSDTYRKVQTWVGNIEYSLTAQHTIGASVQAGKLQDLTGNPERPVDDSHKAAVLYYQGTMGNWYLNASLVSTQRDLPTEYAQIQTPPLPDEIENQRYGLELGYTRGNWNWYLDTTAAKPDTQGSDADTVTALAPGFKYDYGPGWVYVEYLTQDGFIDRNGMIGEGDFEALYVTLDFYL
ncbi:hypothetical protein FT643_07675 [Ketobacter sp. MCCC 1A13808]|uniref:hypothetical protein n=1 Tax=Ketobacter sp. MCCC 1A13808 TaxID=2602738 RepID=UPI0012EBADD3|nr:hypothetical protein [Ketobacter sp. MCCC 1A13808]MVF12025.1 hypothetical protein [Ketobacter sp. MCCC 1A13808]